MFLQDLEKNPQNIDFMKSIILSARVYDQQNLPYVAIAMMWQVHLIKIIAFL